MADLPLLCPDAEADAAGSSFQSFAEDCLDQWHAAIEEVMPVRKEPLSKRLIVTRSAHELVRWYATNPLSSRIDAVMSWMASCCAVSLLTPATTDAVGKLRSAWEPVFRQSERWQIAARCMPVKEGVPWVIHGCAELLWECGQSEDVPSPWAPWLALWGRGVWPTPLGDGALGLWIPRLDEGPAAIERELLALEPGTPYRGPARYLGFSPPRVEYTPGRNGVGFFGPEQSCRMDTLPELYIVPPPPPDPFAPPPTFNPSPAEFQAMMKKSRESTPRPESDTGAVTVIERLRRWFRKE